MSYGLSRARSCGTFVPKFLANFTGLAASRLIPQEFLLILEETARLWMGSKIPRIFASASSVAVGTRLMDGRRESGPLPFWAIGGMITCARPPKTILLLR